MAFVRPQLTSYKRPSEIIVLDALPATSTGKILKHKLAESLHARRSGCRRRRPNFADDRFDLTGRTPCKRETRPWP